MGAANIGAFRALRTLRALRPLRAVSRWEGMKVEPRLSLAAEFLLSPVHTINKVEFNTVDFVESQLFNKSATKSTVAVYVQLCCRFRQQIGNNVNSTSCRGRLCCRYGRRCCQCVRGQTTWSTLWTFNKVDRVEFNFVASVYRA